MHQSRSLKTNRSISGASCKKCKAQQDGKLNEQCTMKSRLRLVKNLADGFMHINELYFLMKYKTRPQRLCLFSVFCFPEVLLLKV